MDHEMASQLSLEGNNTKRLRANKMVRALNSGVQLVRNSVWLVAINPFRRFRLTFVRNSFRSTVLLIELAAPRPTF
jgi:hypothetical protein